MFREKVARNLAGLLNVLWCYFNAPVIGKSVVGEVHFYGKIKVRFIVRGEFNIRLSCSSRCTRLVECADNTCANLFLGLVKFLVQARVICASRLCILSTAINHLCLIHCNSIVSCSRFLILIFSATSSTFNPLCVIQRNSFNMSTPCCAHS